MKNCNQKRYEFHMQNDHYRRMVHDPEYFKGTEEDVSKISLLLALAQRPREEIVGFRRKYRALLHDCEEEFMTQFGLNYASCSIAMLAISLSIKRVQKYQYQMRLK